MQEFLQSKYTDTPPVLRKNNGTRPTWPKKLYCPGCKLTKNRDKFNRKKDSPTGKMDRCIVCEKKRKADYRERSMPDSGEKRSVIEAPAESFDDLRQRLFGDVETQAQEAPGFHAVTQERFIAIVEERKRVYSCCGLDALKDLALMPISQNSMQNQVKYLAAKALVVYAEPAGGTGTAIDEIFGQMAKSFNDHAPRIRAMRATVTLEAAREDPKLIPADETTI